MTFETYAKQKRKLINSNLKKFLKSKRDNTNPKIFTDQKIISNLEDFVLRGKLMRGTLFLLGCQMLGKKIDNDLVNIAVAIEIVHSSLLIHDDIIDNDYLRRGEKTIFAEYINRGENVKTIDPDHYGRSIGIVAGDVGYFLAIELFSNLKNIDFQKLLNFYSNEIIKVGLAEAVDSELGQVKKEATREEIYTVYRLKTARYTFSLPLVMAGIVCKVPKKTIQILENLGEDAGIIFQIRDDEIGLYGSEKQIGKPVGSDIRENKKTLIRAMLFDKIKDAEKKKINNYFGNPNFSIKQVREVTALCNKYKIQEELKNETDIIMKRVWRLFKVLKVENNYKLILKELLEFNLKRAK